MSLLVLDASAMLAYLQGEGGADLVEHALMDAAVCSASNWSETAHRVARAGGDWPLARALLLGYGMVVEPVLLEDAETAAQVGLRHPSLSLGDRLCLALAERLDTRALTADRAWSAHPRADVIRS